VPIDLSVIIVNWNSAEHLRKCLSSIAADQNSPDLEVLVVDNASYDGSAEMVRRQFPWVRFIQSAENLGFAGGNKLAHRHAQGDTLLFLNPDTEVFPHALKRMLERLWASPRVGAVGPRLFNSDLSLQTTCLQAFPTFWNLLFDADTLKVMFPRWRIWGMRPLFSNGTDADVVGMISGACLMVRRDAFDHVEGHSNMSIVPRSFITADRAQNHGVSQGSVTYWPARLFITLCARHEGRSMPNCVAWQSASPPS
jgi:N-acetylglucosaminyl-diphospho-decaprenol L-rhamnosyltransferase